MKQQTPFKILSCSLREQFKLLSPSELMVWVYYYLCTNKDNRARISLQLIAAETGLARNTIKTARRSLVRKKWFEMVQKSRRDKKTKKHTVPVIRVVMPGMKRGQKLTGRGQILTPSGQKLTIGRGQNLGWEVDVGFEVDTEVDKRRISPSTGKSSGQIARQVFAWMAATYPDTGAGFRGKDKDRLTTLLKEERCSLIEAKAAISSILDPLERFYYGQAGDRVVAGFTAHLDSYREAVRAEKQLKIQMEQERAKADAAAAEEAKEYDARVAAAEQEEAMAREFLEGQAA